MTNDKFSPDSESGLNSAPPFWLRQSALHCHIEQLPILGRVFPSLFPLFAPVQILCFRLRRIASLRLCAFALKCLSLSVESAKSVVQYICLLPLRINHIIHCIKCMQKLAPIDDSTARSWICVAASLLALAIGLPIALPFSTPTAVGYVQLPGVIIGVFVAAVCVVAFLLCPRHPLFAKLIALVLCVAALQCAIYFLGYYWVHVRYGG